MPAGVDDLDAVLLTDILPTAWHATEMGEVGPGDVVAIWGAGPGEPQSAESVLLMHSMRSHHYASGQQPAEHNTLSQCVALSCQPSG